MSLLKSFLIITSLLFAICCVPDSKTEEVNQQRDFQISANLICIRVPSQSEIEITNDVLKQLREVSETQIVAQLHCPKRNQTFYIIKAVEIGYLSNPPKYTEPPATVVCCFGVVPLELNPSILVSPLRYFGLQDLSNNMLAKMNKSSPIEVHALGPGPADESQIGFPDLRQPGFVLSMATSANISGVCVIFEKVLSLDQYPEKRWFDKSNQIFGCITKFLGDYNSPVPLSAEDKKHQLHKMRR